ncbi:DMP19 family protein [Vibrio parahaemolyticus]|uniref:DMP19 family protein n=1 Tax=Vibrio parahaemolyticus TaxID=670 RepID=UPI0004195A85|nr:DMP19 family protein [Vibrio parahaemolyticus]MCG6478508.1 DMP19 family protein [Vibrio parahaemolyticus]HCG6765582.1 DMP19 family protein [Vibrio parahaemolyticus]
MKFEDLACKEEPAFEVFKRALELVFEGGDGNTEFLERLSPEARLVYLVWNLDGEIHNGGFDQLFVNSLGDHCSEILAYLRSLNAKRSESLLRAAMSYFPDSEVPKDRQTRVSLWLPISENEEVEKALEALDLEFYEYKDNLSGLLDDFVRANKSATIAA